MKKYILVSMSLLMSCLLFGCGATAEKVVDQVETLAVNLDTTDGLLTPQDLTMRELYNMDVSTVQAIFEKYLPNYRETYGISTEKEMNTADWESLRSFLGYQLWGKEYIAYEHTRESENTPESTTNDENIIYYAPTKEYISSLTIEAYATYLNQMYIYLNGDSQSPDFSQLTPDQLEEIRQEQLSMIDENAEDILAVEAADEKIDTTSTADESTDESEQELELLINSLNNLE